MRIRLESGERLVVEVPRRLASSAAIAIHAEPLATHTPSQPLVDVVIEDGLIGRVDEHVVHRHADAKRVEDRLVLWGHLVSKHATITPLHMTLEELIDMHEHEHKGPGTIRNHSPESREHSLHRIGKVLSEAEPDDDVAPPAAPTDHAYLASYSGGREVGCHLCRKPRSAHKE